MSNIRTWSGFQFIKSGMFKISDRPYKFKNWTSELVIDFYDKRYAKADETVYLLISENFEMMYVGEFTYNLEDRWLSKGHVNHHMYDKIEESINKGHVITIWLAISPYCVVEGCDDLNVSKALEQQIMREYQPKWNARNKQSEAREWRAKNCVKLNTFIATS